MFGGWLLLAWLALYLHGRCSWSGWSGPGAGLKTMVPWAVTASMFIIPVSLKVLQQSGNINNTKAWVVQRICYQAAAPRRGLDFTRFQMVGPGVVLTLLGFRWLAWLPFHRFSRYRILSVCLLLAWLALYLNCRCSWSGWSGPGTGLKTTVPLGCNGKYSC